MTNEPEPNTRAGEALKPCPNPWCDSVDFEAVPTEDSVQLLLDTSRPRFAVYCQYCPQQGPGADTLAEAITAWNTRPLPQPSEFVAEVKRLTALADDHFRNARRLSEVVVAREAQIAKLQADGDKLAGALEAFQRHYDLNDCDERCGALEVPSLPPLRRACQALTEWKDRA